MKKIILITVLIFILINTSTARELFTHGDIDSSIPEKLDYHGKVYDVSEHRVNGDILHNVYGNWVQTFETNSGTVRIIFKKVEDTWFDPIVSAPEEEKVREIEFKQIQDVYEIEVELRDEIRMIELKTPEVAPGFPRKGLTADKTAIIFKDYFRFRFKHRDEGHWNPYARLICGIPLEVFPSYQVIKPKMIAPLFRKTKIYEGLEIDLKDDIFVNKDKLIKETTKKYKKFAHDSLDENDLDDKFFRYLCEDKNQDGIIDRFQVDETSKFLGNFAGGDDGYKDVNNDSIKDGEQTKAAYYHNAMSAFVDRDGDGLCDNYLPGVFDKDKLVAVYDEIVVDLSEDPFQNKQEAEARMMQYTDRNGDDIVDCVQIPSCSSQLTGKPFADKNNDTIDDNLQTVEGYDMLKLKNFVDRDGDGLCDNYLPD